VVRGHPGRGKEVLLSGMFVGRYTRNKGDVRVAGKIRTPVHEEELSRLRRNSRHALPGRRVFSLDETSTTTWRSNSVSTPKRLSASEDQGKSLMSGLEEVGLRRSAVTRMPKRAPAALASGAALRAG